MVLNSIWCNWMVLNSIGWYEMFRLKAWKMKSEKDSFDHKGFSLNYSTKEFLGILHNLGIQLDRFSFLWRRWQWASILLNALCSCFCCYKIIYSHFYLFPGSKLWPLLLSSQDNLSLWQNLLSLTCIRSVINHFSLRLPKDCWLSWQNVLGAFF